MNRDFTVKGIAFHLNDTHFRNEFEGKYTLLYWNCGMEKNVAIGTFDTKKSAVEYARVYAKYL